VRENRVAVIGISGSGKSVFARELAEKTKLPLFHMDNLFWRGDWEAVPESDYLRHHSEVVARDSWVIEGYVDEAMASRLASADLVLYLDFPGLLCSWRVVKRWLMHRKTSRPELPEEARERLKMSFVWMVLMRRERPIIERALDHKKAPHVVRFRFPRDAQTYLGRLTPTAEGQSCEH
jgi:adenylate kinase family enzyme